MVNSERRKAPRFDLTVALKNMDLNYADEIAASTTNISARGIGCISDRDMRVGSLLDVRLYLPDGEVIRTEGVIVWVCREGTRYRIGIELCMAGIRPIPIVLRVLRNRTRIYN